MPLFTKTAEANGTWRLRDASGAPVGRVWATTHIDRVLRDVALAEAVAGVLALAPAARRTAAIAAYQDWATNGGHAVDLSTLSHTIADGNVHLFLGGTEIGYFHGEVFNRGRVLRFIRLAEEVFAAQQLGTATLRRDATDAALDTFRDSGAASDT